MAEPTTKREGWGAFASQTGGWGAFNSQETSDKRAQEQIARSNREREVAAASLEANKEKRLYEEAINLGSAKAYPSLGSAKAEPKTKTTLNFKAVAEAAAKIEVEEEENVVVPKTTVNTFFDNFDDEEEEEDGEFNADIVATRRRGDKGIW
jgi:hypothetical protein